MRKVLQLLVFILSTATAFAQDSVKISYSQEVDTLVKLRFIDRYENVFMTRVPTRRMFKFGYTGSRYFGTGIRVAYEQKIWHSVSLEGGLYVQTSNSSGYPISFYELGFNVWAFGKIRWYHRMSDRIRQKLSANNFSGAYLGLSYDRTMKRFGKFPGYSTMFERVGLLYGFQSRFFNRGYVDLSVGIFDRDTNNGVEDPLSSQAIRPRQFVLVTQPTVGLAIGDWRRSHLVSACDVLLCDEEIDHQWKIRLPDLTVGLKNQQANVEIAYEKSLGDSPFSMDVNADVLLNNNKYFAIDVGALSLGGGVQLRHYFLQKRQIRKGKTGKNFSGPYYGLGANYALAKYRSRAYNEDHWTKQQNQYISTQLSLGVQQRVLSRLYVDASFYFDKTLRIDSQNYGGRFGVLLSRLAIGFTL